MAVVIRGAEYRIQAFDTLDVELQPAALRSIADLNMTTHFIDPHSKMDRTFHYMTGIMMSRPTSHLLLALTEVNELVGYAAFYTNAVAKRRFASLGDDGAYLSSVVVAKKWRGQGVATALEKAFFKTFPTMAYFEEDIDFPDIIDGERKLIPRKLRDQGYEVDKLWGDDDASGWRITKPRVEDKT